MFKALVGATAAIVVGGLASAASAATELKVTSAGMYDRIKVSLSGPVNRDVFAGPVKIEGSANGSSFSVWAFCVDVFHDIAVGYGSQKSVDLTYAPGVLNQNGAGMALTQAQVMKISDLAGYGLSLIGSGESDLRYKLSALQVAIWKIEYDGLSVSTGSARVDRYVDGFVAAAGTYGMSANYVFDTAGKSQGLMIPGGSGTIGIPGVPEPATWALMISGFGAVGFALRRRRVTVSEAA